MSSKTRSKKAIANDDITTDVVVDVSARYRKMKQEQHVLELPDTYIGSVEDDTTKMWVFDRETNKIVYKLITFVPGFIKIYDEILVNARDHSVRDPTCNRIKVYINEEDQSITVWNNGSGIPVVLHEEHQIYIPELIFGNLLTSSNYNEKKKIVGGKNGIGATCTNIFSKKFIVETVDATTRQKYIQEFENNMTVKNPPTITKVKKDCDPYTQITFYPDYQRFGMEGLTPDVIGLLEKRAYDMAACATRGTKVYLNGEKIRINSFEDFILLHYNEEPKLIYTEFNERWKVGIVFNPDCGFSQVSFVNGIWTYRGGTHVDYIVNQIVKKLTEHIKKTNKNLTIKPSQIKEHLDVFIDSVIEDPAFTSQSKEFLTTKVSKFGSTCEIDQGFINRLARTGIVDEVIRTAEFKAQSSLKQTDAKKSSPIKNIPKLEDANWANVKGKSHLCRLILTEGDSAKSFAISGLKVIGRDRYGVFPLRGKLINVRGATPEKLKNNKEFTYLKQILGLKHDVEYTDTSKLRYGGIIILTDQDSVSGDTPLLLKNGDGMYEIKTIDDLNSDWIVKENGKEYTSTDYEVWTERGWTKIRQVIRHKVSKKMYRVLTHTGVVDVTEDHSLLREDGTEVPPNECDVGQTLLHSFPQFDDIKPDIPNNLEDIPVKKLWEYAKLCKIQYYQSYNKVQLIELLTKEKQRQSLSLTDTSIDENEAYVMGLFFADGTCGVYTWDYMRKSRDKTKEYPATRTEYNWSITNTNLNYLNKAIEILKSLYDYNFTIVATTPNQTNRQVCYKLIANGGKSVLPLVQKYREYFYDKDKNKRIPLEILNACRNVRQNFFDGYYDGDGCKTHRTGSKFFDVDGKIGTQGLFFLCKSLGYEVSINHQARKTKVYTLNITKGTQQNNPNIIKKIFDLGTTEQYVYDLETENHHFQAGIGQMIVHNTDGSHIKGLIINMIQYFWPTLLLHDGFIQTMATPLVKVYRKSDKKHENPTIFYSMTDFENWAQNENMKNWEVKYYKGLGTSTQKEQEEAFSDFENKVATFTWEMPEEKKENAEVSDTNSVVSLTKNSKTTRKKKISLENQINKTNRIIYESESYKHIYLAFDDCADARKLWLAQYNRDAVLDFNKQTIPYSEFINKDLIHFSNYDNIRSIPSICDGFKPSHRKIMYVALNPKLTKEVKVAQLAPKVAEKTAYHHGEVSLEGAIVGLAQQFVGSNNINLLYPSGFFGSRYKGGEDAGSSRYIFTRLEDLTTKIYRDEDNIILNYLFEDGIQIEPEYYMPIIPMVLVNGAKGIGTGYSTDIHPYNPHDIYNNLVRLINGEDIVEMTPWFRGFKGTITQLSESKFEIKGIYQFTEGNCLKITELPVRGSCCWTEDYHEFLKTKMVDREDSKDNKKFLTNVVSNSDLDSVEFDIEFKENVLQQYIKEDNGLEKLEKDLKLVTTISTTNMYLYNPQGVITKYDTVEDIMREFYEFRLQMYVKRKEYYLKVLNNALQILKYKVKFIQDILDEKIIINRRKKDEIIERLEERKYPKLASRFDADESEKSYNYLTTMALFSLTEEKIEELQKEYEEKKAEYEYYESKTEKEIWLEELEEFIEAYDVWLETISSENSNRPKKAKKVKTSKSRKTK